jgi:biopolymer transport protein ExbD
MNRRPRSQRLVSEINITPFTDVILVLLIIFMVATPLIFRSSMRVQLPQATQGEEPPRNLNISVGANGEAILENATYNLRYDLDVLKFKLASLAGRNPDSSIVINGDRDVKYDFVIKVMDTAKLAGIKHIVLSTELKR